MNRLPLRRLSRTRRALATGAVALVALAAIACTPTTEVTVQPATPGEQTGIAVSGTGRVVVQPDIAIIDLGVETQGATVAEAREAAAQAMSSLRAAVIGEGVAERDIQTQWFNIYPQYSYSERDAPQIIGFVVSNQVQVRVRNIDTASAVLDAAIDAGGDAVRVNGMRFTVDEPEQHLAAAREDAIHDARERAETLAAAAGVTLGSPRTINESFNGMPPMPFPEFARDGLGGASTPLDPGEQQLTVTISVVYDIQR
jgi:uncharacterized protein